MTAIARSRTDEIAPWPASSLLIGCAPGRRPPSLFGLDRQIVVALVAASMRPYTAVAFAILAPLCGLGLAGLWGAPLRRVRPAATARRPRKPRSW
ncbi:MAG: hypothetical protein R2699_19550 [Acidimicrobiales bacterium]